MEFFLQEIEKALDAKLYYLAIITTVTIPDVCAALASPDGETSGPRYKDWYNANIAPTLTWFSDVDCYKFRCGGIHQGRFGHPEMQYDKALFTLPGIVKFQQGISKAGNEIVYIYSAIDFCKVFIDAARTWFKAVENDATVRSNLTHMARLRPDGLPPHIRGAPLIA
jgi:hypothetical protein